MKTLSPPSVLCCCFTRSRTVESSDGAVFLDASSVTGILSPLAPLLWVEDDVCSLRKKARRKEGEERKVEGSRVGSNRSR